MFRWAPWGSIRNAAGRYHIAEAGRSGFFDLLVSTADGEFRAMPARRTRAEVTPARSRKNA